MSVWIDRRCRLDGVLIAVRLVVMLVQTGVDALMEVSLEVAQSIQIVEETPEVPDDFRSFLVLNSSASRSPGSQSVDETSQLEETGHVARLLVVIVSGRVMSMLLFPRYLLL